MKIFTISTVVAAILLSGTAVSAMPAPDGDLSRFLWQGKRNATIIDNDRQRAVDAAVKRMEAGKPARFVNALEAVGPDGGYVPDYTFEAKDLYGDIDGPDGELWFYQGFINYEYVQISDYYTEERPKSFEVSIYDSDMNLRGTIKDTFVLKENEVRVRQVSVLPIITRNYFNSDDKYEVVVTVIVNPKPSGVVPYSYIYSLGDAPGADGDNVPVGVIDGMVNDVLVASTGDSENIIMTFIHEYNDSGLTEEDIYDWENPDDPEKRANYWQYNLGNKIGMTAYSAAGADGRLTEVFSKTTIYYQAQGNQQDDPLSLTMLHDGKPVIVYPYYEEVFYNPFYSPIDDMSQHLPNNLVVEIYEQPAPGEAFVLKQTSKIPVIKASEDDVLASYYAVGSFRGRDDVVFKGDKADFFVVRRDQTVGDNERCSFLAYNADGSLKQTIFANSDSHLPLSNLAGMDPMQLFIVNDGKDYIFNFFNLRTFETELALNYGLMLDGEDGEPDYIMANVDRTLTPDGKSYLFAAEMRVPGYDDINDINYMRIAYIDRDGKVDHIDQVNMGNNVNYATLYLDGIALQPGTFHSDDKQEYMMLIKRALPEGSDKASEEQLLIAQAADKDNPAGKDLLLLGDCEAGSLAIIMPMYGEQNRLAVIYTAGAGSSRGTTHYYNLPLDGIMGIGDAVAGDSCDISIAGNTVTAPGVIEVYSMQGVRVASDRESLDLTGLTAGLYMVRAAGACVKVALH